MNITVVCIRGIISPTCKCTSGKQYRLLYDSDTSIQLIDDNNNSVALSKELVFDKHFKYLSEVRDNKLETLGI